VRHSATVSVPDLIAAIEEYLARVERKPKVVRRIGRRSLGMVWQHKRRTMKQTQLIKPSLKI
jgi:hypothetical protein